MTDSKLAAVFQQLIGTKQILWRWIDNGDTQLFHVGTFCKFLMI